MKKCLSKLVASVVMGALIVMPVQAAPDTDSTSTGNDTSQSEVESLQSQLSSVLTRIYTLEDQMVTTGEKIIQATAELESAQELEQKQYEDMKLRIKYMYEEGSNNVLEKILASGSISDVLNKAEYIQSIHGYDRDMLSEYASTKEKVAELKSTLETEMADLESMQTEFSEQQASLNSTLANKQSEVSNLNDLLQVAVQATAEEMYNTEDTVTQSQVEDAQVEDTQVEDIQVASADNTTDVVINDNDVILTDDTDNNADNTTNQDDQLQDAEQPAAVEIAATAEEEAQSQVEDTQAADTENTADVSDNSINNMTDSTSNTTITNTENSNNTDDTSNSTSSNTSTDSASSSNTSAAQQIVAAAYTQLGVEYVWGGTTPYVGLDCSGLTQYAHKQAGISIGRTSAVQGAGGQAVTNPQPGDLVCYAGHVGIYIGDGQMIHAPYTGTVVKVQSVYGSPWYRRYW